MFYQDNQFPCSILPSHFLNSVGHVLQEFPHHCWEFLSLSFVTPHPFPYLASVTDCNKQITLPEVQYATGNTCSWRWFGLSNWVTLWTEITQIQYTDRFYVIFLQLNNSTNTNWKYFSDILCHWQTNSWTLRTKCMFLKPTHQNQHKPLLERMPQPLKTQKLWLFSLERPSDRHGVLPQLHCPQRNVRGSSSESTWKIEIYVY